MNLVKQNWTLADGYELIELLKGLGKPDRTEWTRKILNTKMNLFAVPTPALKKVAKEIAKGDAVSCLELNLFECYETTILYGNLLCTLSLQQLKPYLTNYLAVADSWAHCDTLGFSAILKEKEGFLRLSQSLLASKNLWERRVALIILLQLCKQETVLPQIFVTLNALQNETEYYVNMAGAWLLCECFVQHKDKTMQFLQNNTTNKFIINKGIQKCRDSFRVTPQDKAILLQFKQK